MLTCRIVNTENYGIGQYNTGINTAHIYGGIPVFGIPVLEALVRDKTSNVITVHAVSLIL